MTNWNLIIDKLRKTLERQDAAAKVTREYISSCEQARDALAKGSK